MAEQRLDDADIDAVLEQMRRKAVSQGVCRAVTNQATGAPVIC